MQVCVETKLNSELVEQKGGGVRTAEMNAQSACGGGVRKKGVGVLSHSKHEFDHWPWACKRTGVGGLVFLPLIFLVGKVRLPRG